MGENTLQLDVALNLQLDESQLDSLFANFNDDAKRALSNVTALERAIKRVEKVKIGELDYNSLTDLERYVYQLKTLYDTNKRYVDAAKAGNKEVTSQIEKEFGSYNELKKIIEEVEAEWTKMNPDSLSALSSAMSVFDESIKVSQEDIENLGTNLDNLDAVASKVMQSLGEQLTSVVSEAIPELSKNITEFMSGFADGFKEGLEGVDVTKPIVDTAKANLPKGLEQVAQLGIKALGKSGLQGAVANLGSKLLTLVPIIGQVVGAIMVLVAALKLVYGDSIKKGLNDIKKDLQSVIDGVSSERARKRLEQNGFLGLAESLHNVSKSIKQFRLNVEKDISGTNAVVESLNSQMQRLSVSLVKLIPNFTKFYTTLEGYPILFKGLNTAFRGISNTISSLASTLKGKMIDALDIDLGEYYEGASVVIKSIFGDAAQEIEDFSKTAVTSMGITSEAAKNMFSTFATGFTSLGIAADNNKAMSTALLKLSADVSSVFGKDMEDTTKSFYDAIIKGTKGGINALREFGVALDANTMKQYAASQGYKTAFKDLSSAEQATLRYKKAMESLSGLQGAFAVNANTFVGQLKILKANFRDIGESLSKLLQTVLLPVLKVLNNIISAISAAIKAFAGIFGLDFGGISSKTASDLGGIADSADDLADSENDAADAIDKAGKAAKRALAPFHKLNVLQNKQNNSSDGKDGGIGNIIGALENTVTGSIPTMQEMLAKFRDWFSKLDIISILKSLTDGINSWLDKAIAGVKDFYNKLQPWIKLAAGIFNWFVENIKGLKVGELIAEVFGGAFKTLNTLLDNIHWGSFGTFVADIVNGVARVKSAFMELGGVIGGFINAKNKFKLAFWTEADVSDWANSLTLAMQTAMKKVDLSLAYAAAFTKISQFGKFITELFRGMLNAFVPQNAAQLITKKFQALGNYFATEGYKDLLEAALSVWNSFWKAFSGSMDAPQESGLSTWGNLKQGIISGITTGMDAITADDFVKVVYHVLDILVDAFQTVIDKFGKDSPITKMFQGFIENQFGVDFNVFFDLQDGLDLVRSELDKVGDSLYSLSGMVDADDLAWQHFLETHKEAANEIKNSGLSITDAKNKFSEYRDEWAALDPEIRKNIENQKLLTTEITNSSIAMGGFDLHAVAEGLVYNGETASTLAERLGECSDAQKELNTQMEIGASQAQNVRDIEVMVNQDRVTELENYLSKYIETNGTIKQLTDEEVDALERYRTATSDIVRSNIQNRVDEIASTEEHKAYMLEYMSAIDDALLANKVAYEDNAETVKEKQAEVRSESEQTKDQIISAQSEIVTQLDNTITEAGTSGTETSTSYKEGLDSTDPTSDFTQKIIDGIADPEVKEIARQAATDAGLMTGEGLGEGIKTGITDSAISETLTEEADTAATSAYDVITGKVDELTGNLTDSAEGIKDTVETNNAEIQTNAEETSDKIFTLIDDILSNKLPKSLETIKELIKQTFVDSVADIESAWDKMASTIESTATKMSDALDKAADSADKLIDKLKEAASAQREYNSAKSSSSSSNRGYPSSIQGYANGGVFLPNKPQLAILGDNKSQTEYALTTGHLQQIADMMANTLGSIVTGSDQPITIPIYLGNELIDQRVITAGQMHNYRSNGR